MKTKSETKETFEAIGIYSIFPVYFSWNLISMPRGGDYDISGPFIVAGYLTLPATVPLTGITLVTGGIAAVGYGIGVLCKKAFNGFVNLFKKTNKGGSEHSAEENLSESSRIITDQLLSKESSQGLTNSESSEHKVDSNVYSHPIHQKINKDNLQDTDDNTVSNHLKRA